MTRALNLLAAGLIAFTAYSAPNYTVLQEETNTVIFPRFRESIRYEVGLHWFKIGLKRKAKSLSREDAQTVRELIRDRDRLETAYVTVLSMLPTEMSGQLMDSQTPILDWFQKFLQWIIDNWDDIWPIISIIFGMDADFGVVEPQPDPPQPELSVEARNAWAFADNVRINLGNNFSAVEQTTDWDAAFNIARLNQDLENAMATAWTKARDEFKAYSKQRFRNAGPESYRSGLQQYIVGFQKGMR